MKKLILASAIALFAMSSFAQLPVQNPDRRKDMKDMRKDMRSVRTDKMQRRQEIREGDKAEAKQLTKDIRTDKRDMRRDSRDLKGDGVKHPYKRAARQIRRH